MRFDTKRALALSLVALILCASMLIGTTYAWFNDAVSSGDNLITAGNLAVAMYWAEGTEEPTSAAYKDASKTAIFNYEKWEPGYTSVRHLKISNEGSLSLKYQLNFVANGEVTALSDVIDVYYFDPAVQLSSAAALEPTCRLGTLTEVLKNVSNTASGHLLGGQDQVITVALTMREDAANEYQGLSIGSDFSIQLLATQYEYEADSFGTDYDKMASIDNEEEILAAIQQGLPVVLTSDIVLTDGIHIPAGQSVTLDLNGHKLSLEKTCTASFAMIQNEGSLVIRDSGSTGVISFTDTGAGDPAATWGSYTIQNSGELVIEGGKIVNASQQNAMGGFHHCSVALQQNGDTAKTDIKGGVISAPYYRSVRINRGTLSVSGGELDGQLWIQSFGAGIQVNISGGSFGPNWDDRSSVFVENATYDVAFAVTGGDFATKIGADDPTKLQDSVMAGSFGEFSVLSYAAEGAEITVKLRENLTMDLDSTVILTDKINLSVLLNGFNIQADLNGSAEPTAVFHIQKGTSLVIGGEGKVHAIACKSNSKVSAIFNNCAGSLVINGGNYSMTYGSYEEGYLIPTIVDTNSTTGAATTTINGGTFEHTRNMFRNFAQPRNAAAPASLIINGGTFHGEEDDYANIWNQAPNASCVAGDGIIQLLGGTYNYIQVDNDFGDMTGVTVAPSITNVNVSNLP